MKSLPLLAVLLLAAAPGVTLRAEPAPAATTQADADRAWKAVIEKSRMQPPEPLETMSPQERTQWMDTNAATVLAAFEEFYATFPHDPRRWIAVVNMRRCTPSFIKTFGPEFAEKGLDDVVLDEAARAAFETKISGYEAALRAAPDVPPVTREAFFAQNASRVITAVREARARSQTADWTAARAALDDFAALYPKSAALAQIVTSYLALVEAADPARAAFEWRSFATSPNLAVKQIATQKLQALAAFEKPLELTFTAADGRPVDLAALRGRVVLLDFWATWCAPCQAEMPNLKAVYAKYHDRGFEIIGVALENARLSPEDSAEQTAEKLSTAKQRFLRTVADQGLTWPHYFDGTFWKNPLAARFGISSLPAMILLDQECRLVTTSARGPQLEAEVRRLLKL